ncbi:MAG TPA: hypothetical protein VEC12_11710 [Bacteroidia bacterium]|nr:hypothetical protein [Bacteroidia bacterium]
MKTIIKSMVVALLAITVTLVSCKKVENEIKNTTTTAEDITRTEAYLGSVFNIAEDAANSDGRLMKTGSTILPSGAVMTFTDSIMDTDGVTYFIDFGTAPGVLCLDGVTRAGRIDVKQSKRFSEIGAVVEVSLPESNNFAASTVGTLTKISGKAVVTRLATNKINLKIENGKAENTTDGTVTFSSNKDIERIELGDPGMVDDEYRGTGSGSGINSGGKPYTWQTLSEVVKIEKTNCALPVKGIIELTSEKSTYKIDFEPDGGGCDKKVQITLPNGTKVVKTF